MNYRFQTGRNNRFISVLERKIKKNLKGKIMKSKNFYRKIITIKDCYAFGYECVFIAPYHNKTDEF